MNHREFSLLTLIIKDKYETNWLQKHLKLDIINAAVWRLYIRIAALVSTSLPESTARPLRQIVILFGTSHELKIVSF